MNTIKIILLDDGTTARIEKDFAVYKNSYRNVLIDIYVPKSILKLNLGYTHSVKIGAERTAENGAETTTNSYYVDYKTTETIANVEYYVFERLLPREFVEIAGNETIITNVVLFGNSSLSEIITSEIVNFNVQDSNYILDDEIEDDDTVAEIEADITDLQESVGQSETDITEIQRQVAKNTKKIATNTSQIAEIIADLNIQETYIGKIEATIEPIPPNYEELSTKLDDYVELHTDPSREPRNGDVIIYVYQNPGTDKNYKFIYSATTGWNYYELPPMEQANNTTFGLVKGSYNQTRNVKVSINAGEFTEIYVKNLTTGNYYTLANFLKSLYDKQQAIISGSQAVELANKAVSDGNGNNIANTYLTKNAGATKEFVKDYSLPKEFYQTYFIESDGYTDKPPTEPVSGVQFTKQTSAVGEFEIFDIYRTNNSKMRLTAKNSSSTTIYISANQNTTIQLKLLNYIKKPNENAQTLSVELSNELELTSGSIYKVDFQSNFNDLDNVFDADENDIVGQVLSVITQDIATTTYSIYSNEVYPSSQTMNVQSLVVVTQQGNLGEIPVYDLTGVIDDENITFDFGNKVIYRNTLARFILRVSQQTQLPTTDTLNLVYGSQNVRIATPYNYLSGDATIDNLSQTNITFDAVNGTVINFIGFINIDSGDNITVIVNEDNLTNSKGLFYCTYGTTTYNQISQAVSAGKLPICKYGDVLYKYSYKAPNLQGVPMIYFTELHSDRGRITSKSIVVNQSDNWFETNVRLQIYIDADNKLNADFVNDANSTHKFVTSSEKSQITTNQNNIASLQSGKQDNLSTTQMNAVNSGITSSLVTKIGNASLTTTATDLSGAINELNASKSVVSANPTLAGTEADLTGIEINGMKYKITGSGGSGGITDYQIINRPNALPTATATSPDFVQYNGKLYRKQISGGVPSTITDLTGTSWELKDTLSTSPSGWSLGDDSGRYEKFYINFTFVYQSLTTNADYIIFSDLDNGPDVIGYHTGVNSPEVYSFFTGWLSPIYKNINIIGGTDATNSKLISWLQANATMQPTTTYEYVEVGASSGSATWGSITGTLSNQTDLRNALNGKQDTIDSSHKLSADYISNGTNNKVFTATEQTKLSGIEAGAEVNDITDVKVNNSSVVTNKVANIDLSGYVQSASLASVATSGSYTDLSNKPTIPTIVANPILAGTESDLTGLEVDGTKYKVPTGGGSAGVSSLGGATGAITLGSGLTILNNVLGLTGGGSGSLSIDLLWTNPNPAQTFNSQSVTPTNLNDYELINVIFVDSKYQLTNMHNIIISKGSSQHMMQEWWESDPNKRVTRLRQASFKTDGTVSFGNAQWWRNGGTSSTTYSERDNDVIIPLYIYGIK